MNELMVKYQLLGELKHTIFIDLYQLENISQELQESMHATYELLLEEQAKVFKKVLENSEGV
jgi:hypothetical protein